MDKSNKQLAIESGKTALGIEFGSTRIKAVLIGADHTPLASGAHAWENQFEEGLWTYSLEAIWSGLQNTYRALTDEVLEKYGVTLTRIGALGFSGMMHGYMVFDKDDNLLVPFRTWRNTNTGDASTELTQLFQFNIPHRWSIAHLHQAILNEEPHVDKIAFQTTLAGYVHWKLTGKKILGVGEASGMFPIDSNTNNFDATRIAQYNKRLANEKLPYTLEDIFPAVQIAGETAGTLTTEGAKLLDPAGNLQAGIPLCPPEGDAGTGMVATNAVAARTGNVSAGTSVFAMIVLEKELSKLYPEIDMVTTPSGKPVAMVHANNCTSDINAWIALFGQFLEIMGIEFTQNTLFETLYKQALEGDPDAGGLLSYNYFSGEPITHFEDGRPLFVRSPESKFTLANFMRTHLYSALGALNIGMNILFEKEKVKIEKVLGHGGFFKTEVVGQAIMAAALNVPISVMDTAGEGGAWGIALLVAYMTNKANGETLETYLNEKVFADKQGSTLSPTQKDLDGFKTFMTRYKTGLAIEKTAIETLNS